MHALCRTHLPAEGLRAARGADVEVAQLRGSVRGVLANQWNGICLHRLWTGDPQLRGQGQNYWYGQGPCMGQPSRAAELRDDLSHAVTLPFPHLFYTERERDANDR